MTGSFASVLSPPGGRVYSFADAVISGWADDGGMLWPTHVPRLDAATLSAWSALSYPQLCAAVLKCFVAADDVEVTPADIDAITLGAFSSFGSADVVDVAELKQSQIHIAELWHGPTLAFKDLGMQVLGRTLSHLLARRNERLTLLVGTSGDTGSSAIEAVRNLDRIEIIVLYPMQTYSSITPVQEWQMTSVAAAAANVTVVGVEGSSDDLDVPMEACFRDAQYKARHRLGSVNSVNIVRLLVQAVHYLYVHLRLDPTATRTVEFAVPCGAGGHLAAGLLAIQMGLPIRLIAATNANDALHRVLSTGSLRTGIATQPTASPSMDIQMPYNLWRLLFVASGGDGRAVRAWQSRLNSTGALEVPLAVRAWIGEHVRSVAVSDASTFDVIRAVHAADEYVLDPHTAVGVAAAWRHPYGSPAEGGVVCMGCAHAVKFLPMLARAFGTSVPAAFEMVPQRERRHTHVATVGGVACTCRPQGGGEEAAARTSRGRTTVFRRGDEWEARLRMIIEGVTHRAGGAPASRL